MQLLLACEIEVITETLDNFRTAGVACAGDLVDFNTPEELDQAVDDITLEDARKLLKRCVALAGSLVRWLVGLFGFMYASFVDSWFAGRFIGWQVGWFGQFVCADLVVSCARSTGQPINS